MRQVIIKCISKITPMKILVLSSLMIGAFMLPSRLAAENINNANSSVLSFNEEEVKNRVMQMDLPFEVQYTQRVDHYLKEYLITGKRQSSYIVKRSGMYFPIFEHYLKAYNMPEELKYLAVVESSLKPGAHSSVGAKGLWQLMSGTARELGLRVDAEVDERMDPYKSTEAALKYLAKLYDQYEDWSLAIAAYNCGPGTVNKAIRRAGNCYNFWSIQDFLPGQTKHYVPRFIASSYTMEYYFFHNIQSSKLDYDLQFTSTIKVFNTVSFNKLARASGTSVQLLQKLNPSYLKSYIPANAYGNYIRIPSMNLIHLSDYLSWSQDKSIKTDIQLEDQLAQEVTQKVNGRKAVYLDGNDYSDLKALAEEFSLDLQQIKKWNKTKLNFAYPGQKVLLFLSPELALAIENRV